MKTFRATIRRTIEHDQVVEIEATSLRDAARKVDEFSAGGSRRGITVLQAFDEDRGWAETKSVVDVIER